MKRALSLIAVLAVFCLCGFVGWLGSQTIALRDDGNRQMREISALREQVKTAEQTTTTTTTPPATTTTVSGYTATDQLKGQLDVLRTQTGQSLAKQQVQINCLIQANQRFPASPC